MTQLGERKGKTLMQLKIETDLKELLAQSKYFLLFIALSALLLIGVGLLPKSPVPLSVPGSTVTSVSVPGSTSPFTQLFTVIETHTATSP